MGDSRDAPGPDARDELDVRVELDARVEPSPPKALDLRELVLYNPRGLQVAPSHDSDLLRLSRADQDRQRGFVRVSDAARAGWKRFEFD